MEIVRMVRIQCQLHNTLPISTYFQLYIKIKPSLFSTELMGSPSDRENNAIHTYHYSTWTKPLFTPIWKLSVEKNLQVSEKPVMKAVLGWRHGLDERLLRSALFHSFFRQGVLISNFAIRLSFGRNNRFKAETERYLVKILWHQKSQ